MALRIASATTAPRAEQPRERILVGWATDHRAALVSLLVIAGIYIGALALLPPQALTHHDEGAKYLQVRNLRITSTGLDWSINYPARRLDPQLQFVPFQPKQHYIDSQGRIYLQWPIFLGLLTRIFWKVLGFWGLYVVPLVAGLGTLWASYLLALAAGIRSRVAWLAVPLVGLATPVPIYSLLYFEHTLASLLVALSVTFALKAIGGQQTAIASSNKARGNLAISGGLLAAGVHFRSELYVLALVLFGALLIVGLRTASGWKTAVVWVAAFGVALVPLWAFYAITEGTLLPTHALWYFAGSDTSGVGTGGIPKPGLPPLRYIANAGWGVVPAFLLGPQDVALAPRYPWWVEWSAIAGTALCVLSALAATLRGRLQQFRLPAFSFGLALVLIGTGPVLFSTQQYYNLHGFLLASPFVALALWQPKGGGQGSFLYGVSLCYVALHALIISALSGLGPLSLHEWGQRYILPAYPLLVVLCLLSLSGMAERLRVRDSRLTDSRVTVGLFALLALVGLGFTARGYVMLSEERAQVTDWLALVRTLPASEPVVTDTWWLPLNLAADFYTRPFMLAEGNSRLEQWAAQMHAHGVTSFGFATTDPTVFSGDWTKQVQGVTPQGPPREEKGLWLQSYSLSAAS